MFISREEAKYNLASGTVLYSSRVSLICNTVNDFYSKGEELVALIYRGQKDVFAV